MKNRSVFVVCLMEYVFVRGGENILLITFRRRIFKCVTQTCLWHTISCKLHAEKKSCLMPVVVVIAATRKVYEGDMS